jgi:hypothetical protein
MFRSASLAALVCSLALDLFPAVGVSAHAGTDTSVTAESGLALTPIEPRTVSEPSVLLLIGLSLITVSRAARR